MSEYKRSPAVQRRLDARMDMGRAIRGLDAIEDPVEQQKAFDALQNWALRVRGLQNDPTNPLPPKNLEEIDPRTGLMNEVPLTELDPVSGQPFSTAEGMPAAVIQPGVNAGTPSEAPPQLSVEGLQFAEVPGLDFAEIPGLTFTEEDLAAADPARRLMQPNGPSPRWPPSGPALKRALVLGGGR